MAMSLFITFLDSQDSSKRGAEKFLITNNDIRDHVGNVSSYDLHTRRFFGAAGNRSPYREYIFVVKGDKMNAKITICADQISEDGGKVQYSVIEIQQDN